MVKLLKDFSPLNYPEYYCNNGDYEKNMYKTSGMEANKSDCPGYEQDYCDDVK